MDFLENFRTAARLIRHQSHEPDSVLKQLLGLALQESPGDWLELHLLIAPLAGRVLSVGKGVGLREADVAEHDLIATLSDSDARDRLLRYTGFWVMPLFEDRLVGYLKGGFGNGDELPKRTAGLLFFAEMILLSLQRRQLGPRAERKTQASSLFLPGEAGYDLAHRLGNDLGLIPLLVEEIKTALGGRESTGTVTEDLNTIADSSRRALDLVNRMKQQLGGLKPLEPARVELVNLIKETAKAFGHLPNQTRLVVGPMPPSITIRAVPEHVKDILAELITNAVEVMPEGGRIQIDTLLSGDLVRVYVRDSGSGIPLEQREQVFKFMYSTKGSSGFGLWSAQRKAGFMGGSLELEQAYDQGASFVLSLPLDVG